MPYILSSLLAFSLTLSFIIGFNFSSNQQGFISAYHQLLKSQADMPDFSQYSDVKKKKADFFNYLLPKVNLANDRILAERHFVKSLQTALTAETEASNLSSLQTLRLKLKKKASKLLSC